MCTQKKLSFFFKKRNFKRCFWLLNSFLATVRPSAWRGVCAAMKGILKYTLLMNIFCLENPHASHNAVNGSRGWSEASEMPRVQPWIQPCPLSVSSVQIHPQPPSGTGSPHLLGNLLRELPWEHPKCKLPAGHRRSSSQGLHHSQPIFCLHYTIFCGGTVWKKTNPKNQKPSILLCIHNHKGQIRGVQAHLILAFPAFHQVSRTAWYRDIYNTYICTQTFIWFACPEYEIVCLRTGLCFPYLFFFLFIFIIPWPFFVYPLFVIVT